MDKTIVNETRIKLDHNRKIEILFETNDNNPYDRENVENLLSRFFEYGTLSENTGLYKGKWNKSYKFELLVAIDESRDHFLSIEFAQEICRVYSQECVLIVLTDKNGIRTYPVTENGIE